MLVKDQIRMQMDRLGVSHRELAKRIGISEQTARFWTSGRSYPAKKRIPDIEQALSFKLDFSEGAKVQGPTVSAAMEAADIELFLKLRRLPPSVRLVFEQLVDVYLRTDPVAPFNEIVRTGDTGVAPFRHRVKEAEFKHAPQKRKGRSASQESGGPEHHRPVAHPS